MKYPKNFIGSLIALVFFAGLGVITYQTRPVMELASQTPSNTSENAQQTDLVFTMDEIQTHNSSDDCWTTINGSVYDLTEWVSRHPGGSRSIIAVCGEDGSSDFNKEHGHSKHAQSTLALYKIGTLE